MEDNAKPLKNTEQAGQNVSQALQQAQGHLTLIQQYLGETPGGIKRRRNPKFYFSQN
jgi:hypothetical protein